jgi:anti-sigma B factor antagonist
MENLAFVFAMVTTTPTPTTTTQSAAELRSGNLSIATDGTLTRIWIEGVLDALTAPEVREGLDRIVAGKPPRVIVDLSRLRIIDGHGIRLLTNLSARLRQIGCEFSVAGAQQQPLAVLRLFKLDLPADR